MVQTAHFFVDNGDMMLVELESRRHILIDIKIRAAADDENDPTPDVGGQLRDRLEEKGRDAQGRLYVDAFLLTHPDQDHISGLQNHFHLGPLSAWRKADDKIVIREMWSSPIVFRRADRRTDKPLCADAVAWRTEARRRANLFKGQGYLAEGDRIRIIGEDIAGKTTGLDAILVRPGTSFSMIDGYFDPSFEALLLAPLLADNDEEANLLSKNNSSVVMRLKLSAGGNADAARYLLGGDAEVAIWERLWDRYDRTAFTYHVLLAPHHCSWHSLSWQSWSDFREAAVVSPKAKSALAQAEPGATILSSSVAIKDDENDPPCIRAKREYLSILDPVRGEFRCIADEPGDGPFEIEIGYFGPKPKRRSIAGTYATGIGAQPLGHG